MRGVDGLTRCGSTYYGIYNGAAPGLLVSITRTDKGIEFDQPLGDVTLPDPTQIAFDGKRLLIVADSGWASLDKPDFKSAPPAPRSSPCRWARIASRFRPVSGLRVRGLGPKAPAKFQPLEFPSWLASPQAICRSCCS